MKKFKVEMTELGKDGKIHKLNQTAICRSRQEVVNLYGLNEPDILDYNITEVDEEV